MKTTAEQRDKFVRKLSEFINQYYDAHNPERHLTRIRKHECEPTREQFDAEVRQILEPIAFKYYGSRYEIILPDGRLGMDLPAVLHAIGLSNDIIDKTYNDLLDKLQHQYEEADEFIQFRISDALKKPHNQIPRELTIAKIITSNEQLNARDLALRLDHWLGTHTIQQWINIFRERWRDHLS